jgi:hypothetical protein
MKSFLILFDHKLCIFTPVKWQPYDEICRQKCVSGWAHIEGLNGHIDFLYMHVAGSDVINPLTDIDMSMLLI